VEQTLKIRSALDVPLLSNQLHRRCGGLAGLGRWRQRPWQRHERPAERVQMEKAGAVSLMLEDQVSPKRCGHMSGKHVIPADEFVGKIKAALDARQDEDFTILARTDAIAVNGWMTSGACASLR
jgi:hypothetical protein